MEWGDILAQCAESRVHECNFYGHAAVVKHRFVKAYRHPVVDKRLREQRTVREARALVRCQKLGVRVPTVYAVDKKSSVIVMERLEGVTAKEFINTVHATGCDGGQGQPQGHYHLLERIGEVVGVLHAGGIVHGDLTTSNFMVLANVELANCDANNSTTTTTKTEASNSQDHSSCVSQVAVIDFGLVQERCSPEERAVDLYVLERAIQSSHPFLVNPEVSILSGYQLGVKDADFFQKTMARLEVVRARGRKRSMVG